LDKENEVRDPENVGRMNSELEQLDIQAKSQQIKTKHKIVLIILCTCVFPVICTSIAGILTGNFTALYTVFSEVKPFLGVILWSYCPLKGMMTRLKK